MAMRPASSAWRATAKPLILRADALVLGDLDVAQDEVHATETTHAERVDARLATDARSVERDEEGRDAASARAWLGGGKDDRDARMLAVGDPHLASVETVTARRTNRRRLLVRRVGAGVGLRERERPEQARPRRGAGSQRSCCAVEPARAMTSTTSELCTARMTAIVALARAMASMASA